MFCSFTWIFVPLYLNMHLNSRMSFNLSFRTLGCRVCFFWQEYHKSDVWSFQCSIAEDTWYWFVPLLMILTLITLLGMCLPSFSTVELLFSFLELISILWKATLRLGIYPVTLQTFTVFLALTEASCLNQLLLWWLANDDFLILSLYLHLLIGFLA